MITDDQILKHFNFNQDSEDTWGKWDQNTKSLFLHLAKAINKLGLDWFFIDSVYELRFGQKQRDAQDADIVVCQLQLSQELKVKLTNRHHANWPTEIKQDFPPTEFRTVTKYFVDFFEKKTQNEIKSIIPKLTLTRLGYWPDEYIKPVIKQNPKNVIYYGPPGTGKTYKLRKELAKYDSHVFVTFHQSYGYEEFIEGLRPILNADQGQVQYKILDGTFLTLCKQASNDPENHYAVVIDEINRGNISKIFGELITLIEIDKREGGDQKISATLAYSGHSFSVPSNVDIIGAMNTADRSLALVDTALRRRFEFIPIMPDTSKEGPLKNAQVNKDNKEIDVRTMLEKINQRIEALYDKDHTIGHAYFTSLTEPFESDEKRFQALKSIFRNRIIPLLEEYFFEDWQKIQLVLGDNQKNRENRDLQFVQDISKKDDLALFGEGHNLDLEAIQQRFQLNEAAFDNPEAYRLIYTP